MNNSEKIENIKSTLNKLKGINPKGVLLEAQAETQVIVAEELIKANINLCRLNAQLESVELMIRQGK